MTERGERILWLTAMLLCLSTLWLRRFDFAAPVADAVIVGAPTFSLPNAATLAEVNDEVAAADPFHWSRDIADGDQSVASPSTGPTIAKAPMPMLSLHGIVGGPPWRALVEGVPGRNGPVFVKAGDTLGGLTIRAVRRDSVVVQGRDTTWHLALVSSWR